jgi:hypothetical protein
VSVSKTTPNDLAVSFRSLTRRREEAIEAAEGAPVGGLLAELDQHVAAAAALLGSAPTPEAVASAIGIRQVREWDGDTLEDLRRHAVDAAAVLRRIAAAGPHPD